VIGQKIFTGSLPAMNDEMYKIVDLDSIRVVRTRRKSAKWKMPLSRLSVGQCFFVPRSDSSLASVKGLCERASKKLGYKLLVYPYRDNNVLGALVVREK
jgi:hypothetical protein